MEDFPRENKSTNIKSTPCHLSDLVLTGKKKAPSWITNFVMVVDGIIFIFSMESRVGGVPDMYSLFCDIGTRKTIINQI